MFGGRQGLSHTGVNHLVPYSIRIHDIATTTIIVLIFDTLGISSHQLILLVFDYLLLHHGN